MNNGKSALIVFARQPVSGKVKTRLGRDLSADLVLDLYKSMVKHAVRAARAVRGCRKIICYAGGGSPGFFERYEKVFELKRQRGADLGERMLNALGGCLGREGGKAVVIGTDCPGLSRKDILTAFSKLEKHDIVLGPSRDGGYYLIGVKEPRPELFEGIDWGTGRVFAQTMARVRKMGWRAHFLRLRTDIDTLEDLKRQLPVLRRRSRFRSFVRKWEKERQNKVTRTQNDNVTK